MNGSVNTGPAEPCENRPADEPDWRRRWPLARIFAERREICRTHGLEPLVPLDNEATTAEEIYQANVRLLDRCDGVIANLTPFRGPHCDVGTAWEIGYAVARERPVFGFSE